MTMQKYLRKQIRKRFGYKVTPRNFNTLVGFVIVCALCWYVYVWPILVSLWKLWRVASLLNEVELGKDNYNPDPLSTQRVPPIIHHMTPDDHSLPGEWQHSHDSCLGVHQRFEGKAKYTFKLWRDKDLREFIATQYSWFLDTYDSYPQNIQRVDAARYFLLRKYGGIYLDLDVGCRRSVDNLLRLPDTGMILPETSPMGLSNDFMISAIEHPFLIYVTERLEDAAVQRWYSDYLTVMLSTGPLFISLAVYEYVRVAPQMSKDMGMLSYDDYTKRLLFHMPGSTWLHSDGKIIVNIFNHAFFYLFIITSCCICVYYQRDGGFDRLTKRTFKMKNVNTVKDLVDVVTETGIDRAKAFAASKLPVYEKASELTHKIGDNAVGIMDRKSTLSKAQQVQAQAATQSTRWRHGRREVDEYGVPIPLPQGSLMDDTGTPVESSDESDKNDDKSLPLWARGDYSDDDGDGRV